MLSNILITGLVCKLGLPRYQDNIGALTKDLPVNRPKFTAIKWIPTLLSNTLNPSICWRGKKKKKRHIPSAFFDLK